GTSGNVASLNAAIYQANVIPGADIVELQAGCRYTLSSPDNYWYGPNGLMPIASDITIDGNGATIARSSASGTPPFRLFFVGANPASGGTTDHYVSPGAGKLTLRDVRLTGGFARGGDSRLGGGGAGMGGAIFSQGAVVVDHSTLADNNAVGGSAINTSAGYGGGGMGTRADSLDGGGFGPQAFPGASGGLGDGAPDFRSGGGAGYRTTERGSNAFGAASGPGGGPATGLGGTSGSGGGA